jgi:23S rRNA pseudouridine1911/1915/1917 synthase
MGAKYRAGGLDDPEDEAGEDAATEDAPERRMAEVDAAGHGERLDRWLTGLAPEFSRNHLQSLIERGCVAVDGRALQKAAHKLRAGQRVEVELQPTDESRAFRAEAMVLDLAFEDEHLLVVDKPAGLVVHPAAGNWSGTLMNGLLAHHPAAANRAQSAVAEFQHAPGIEEALYIMGESYDQLGLTQLRDDARRVLDKNFPDSEFASNGGKRKKAWWKFW